MRLDNRSRMNREVHARFFQRIADLQKPVTASCGEKNYKNAKPIWQSQFYFAAKEPLCSREDRDSDLKLYQNDGI